MALDKRYRVSLFYKIRYQCGAQKWPVPNMPNKTSVMQSNLPCALALANISFLCTRLKMLLNFPSLVTNSTVVRSSCQQNYERETSFAANE